VAPRWFSYSDYFRQLTGGRVQKLAVNAGFGCPNRDGTVGTGGCTFCRNDAFTPSYCMTGGDVAWQLREGIEFHRRRYRKAEKYLAYFQSFSNTYAPVERLREVYERALEVEGVMGIVVGTRPDCVDTKVLALLEELARKHYVAVEYGIESCRDETLREVNRGHDFACARRAVHATAERGIPVGAHFILGLPGETDEMLIGQVAAINELPLTSVKFHQLQIFAGTAMEEDYRLHPERYRFWTLPEYIDFFIEILRRLRPDIAVERFAGEAPPRYHAGPSWGLVRNEQLTEMLRRRMEELDTRQGEII
jgi:radical SAM protein (TIGR01212 family)